MENKISIVVGSWGSYNACNERALGSSWLCLNDFDSWEDIEEELIRQGFELNGLDEELFIQDIEGLKLDNCDTTHPKWLFEILDESLVLHSENYLKIANAYIEVYSFNEFCKLVDKYGFHWNDNIYLYDTINNFTDLAYVIVVEENIFSNCNEIVTRYFNYEAFGRDLSFDNYYLTSYGILEVR